MDKCVLAAAMLLLLLPLAYATVGEEIYYTDDLAYFCKPQSDMGIKYQYLPVAMEWGVDMLVKGPLAPNSVEGEITQNANICWESGTKIKITPIAGGDYALNPGTRRGYLGHPPVAWLPKTAEGGYPAYSTATTYSSPAICRVASIPANTLNSLLTLQDTPISYITLTSDPNNFNPPCGPAPDKYCYCTNLLNYDYTVKQGAQPPTPPASWIACQEGIGAYTPEAVVICKAELRIYETTTGTPVLKKTILMKGKGDLSKITFPTEEIELTCASPPCVKKFRTDLFIEECGIYSVTTSPWGTPRFYKDSYPLTTNVLLQGKELVFNANSCGVIDCKIAIEGQPAGTQADPVEIVCNPPQDHIDITVDYKDIVTTGGNNGYIDCSPVTSPNSPFDFYFPATGTSTGYGGLVSPVTSSCSKAQTNNYNDNPASSIEHVHARISSSFSGGMPGLAFADCDGYYACAGEPYCSLSVQGSDSEVCDPSYAFNVRVNYNNVKGGDKLVVDGTTDANPPAGGKYELTKAQLNGCGDGSTYCDGPFTYSSSGTRQITGYIIENGWGPGLPGDTIYCSPQEEVHCTIPGALPCNEYI